MSSRTPVVLYEIAQVMDNQEALRDF